MALQHGSIDELGAGGQFLRLRRVVRVNSEDAILTRFLDQTLLVARGRLDRAHRVPFQVNLLLMVLGITAAGVQIHAVLLLWNTLELWRHERAVSLCDSRKSLFLSFRQYERLLGLIVVVVGVLLSHGQIGNAWRLH